jgi:hypothetical protein
MFGKIKKELIEKLNGFERYAVDLSKKIDLIFDIYDMRIIENDFHEFIILYNQVVRQDIQEDCVKCNFNICDKKFRGKEIKCRIHRFFLDVRSDDKQYFCFDYLDDKR